MPSLLTALARAASKSVPEPLAQLRWELSIATLTHPWNMPALTSRQSSFPVFARHSLSAI
nr:hypothetical protein [Mycobacterium marinum]